MCSTYKHHSQSNVEDLSDGLRRKIMFALKGLRSLDNLCVSTPILKLEMAICMICNCSLYERQFPNLIKPAAKIVCGVEVPTEGPYPFSTNVTALLSMLFYVYRTCRMRSPTTNKSMAQQVCVTMLRELTIQRSQLWHFNSLEPIPRQLSNSRYRTRACSSQLTQTRVVWLWYPPRMDSALSGISTKPTISSFLIM